MNKQIWTLEKSSLVNGFNKLQWEPTEYKFDSLDEANCKRVDLCRAEKNSYYRITVKNVDNVTFK